ncbi:hypothetical protein GCM10023187_01470 [Nibrella viscosa]|uniref:Uncharacterized protein n=1 Tax=Nibrella viscosa TaxID=1084524 RepID=A0ABP8JRC5_9BACT
MEARPQTAVVRMLCGINSADYTYHRLTFFESGRVRIESPYSQIDTHQEVPIVEDSARLHKWLIWDLEEHQTEQWV